MTRRNGIFRAWATTLGRRLLPAIVALLVGGATGLGALLPPPAAAQSGAPVRVLFINPATPEDQHWTVVSEVMQAAANDLNVQLTIEHAFHSGPYTLEYATLAAQKGSADYIIFRNVGRIATKVFQVAHSAGIRTITIDAPLEKVELDLVGGPRQKIPTWLGQVVPNALQGSEKLTELLIQDMQARGMTGLIELISVSGPEDDIGSKVRVAGLKRGLAKIPGARLKHDFPSGWDYRSADRNAYEAFRYGAKVPIWWTADDDIARGVVNVLRNTHRKIGRDTLVGTFNWTEPMMTAVLKNQVRFVAGGHFIQGAAALILAHDHARGRDFADVGLNHTMSMSFLYKDNIKSVGRIMISRAWDRIDFRRFSRVTNPALAQYDFNPSSYLRAVLGQ